MAVILAMLPILAGCPGKVVVPPVTENPTPVRHIGKIVWYDLFTNDIAASSDFYAALFGWEMENLENRDDAKTVLLKGYPVANIMERDMKAGESQWLGYISVEQVEKSASTVIANGGYILKEAFDMPDRGRVAIVKDSQGAPFGMLVSPYGDPLDFALAEGEWLGGELWTKDVDVAAKFYQELAGYVVVPVDVHEKVEYRLLFKGEEPRAGLVSIPGDRASPQWVPYVAVTNIQATVDKAVALGGKILIAPDMAVKNGHVAIMKDPTGAVFGMQELGGE